MHKIVTSIVCTTAKEFVKDPLSLSKSYSNKENLPPTPKINKIHFKTYGFIS